MQISKLVAKGLAKQQASRFFFLDAFHSKYFMDLYGSAKI